jgi:putative sterol carrier protein
VAADAVREFFAGLASRVDPARTAGMNASYVFAVDGAGTWTVRVVDGAVSVTEGAEDADVTIAGDAETFHRIASGEQSPTGAYMSGKLKVDGNIGVAMKLKQLF